MLAVISLPYGQANLRVIFFLSVASLFSGVMASKDQLDVTVGSWVVQLSPVYVGMTMLGRAVLPDTPENYAALEYFGYADADLELSATIMTTYLFAIFLLVLVGQLWTTRRGGKAPNVLAENQHVSDNQKIRLEALAGDAVANAGQKALPEAKSEKMSSGHGSSLAEAYDKANADGNCECTFAEIEHALASGTITGDEASMLIALDTDGDEIITQNDVWRAEHDEHTAKAPPVLPSLGKRRWLSAVMDLQGGFGVLQHQLDAAAIGLAAKWCGSIRTRRVPPTAEERVNRLERALGMDLATTTLI